MRWAGNVALKGERIDVYRVLVGRSLWRPRHRREDNIKINIQEVGCGDLDSIELAQDRNGWRALVNAVMNLRVPKSAENFLTSGKPIASLEGLCSME
jgi:hypothetical protein